MADSSQQFDTSVELITPENISFHYRTAGPFRRLPAYLIDLIIRIMVIIGLAIVLRLVLGLVFRADGTAVGLIMLAVYFMEYFYAAIFEAYLNGQTPGKNLLHLRVMSSDGQPINGMQAVLRNFVRAVDTMPTIVFVMDQNTGASLLLPMYMLAFWTAAMNKRQQRLGDLAAGTMVVAEEPQPMYGVLKVTEVEVVELARQIPKDFQVSRSLARALSDYVSRRKGFSWNRRAEIAAHVGEPLRKRFELPSHTSHDLLLCALYHRVFLSDDGDEPMDALIVTDDTHFPQVTGGWSR